MAALNNDLPPVRACIFDMDGLLIDSEDIYTEVTNTILKKYDRPNLPWTIKAQLQGRPGPAANEIFHQWAKLPCTHAEYAQQQGELQAALFPKTQPLPGVLELLRTLRDDAGIDLAIATSSHARNYALKTSHLPELFDVYFGTPAAADASPSALPSSTEDPDTLPKIKFPKVLGDDVRIPKGRGKPRGDIYLLALKLVNEAREKRGLKGDIKPEECLVFEDSVPGIEAGRRAGMRVVWAPHPELKQVMEGQEAEILAGRTGASELPEEEDVAKERGLVLWPSKVGDGCGGEVKTLENFDYARFGVVLRK